MGNWGMNLYMYSPKVREHFVLISVLVLRLLADWLCFRRMARMTASIVQRGVSCTQTSNAVSFQR